MLRPSIPPPFFGIRPASLAPLVLTCEHATNRLPPGVAASALEREILTTHWGWDIGGWALTRELARRLGTGAVGGRWSRLWVDLNRRVDEETVLRETVEGSPISWNRGLSEKDREQRLLEFHRPYHDEVDRQIVRRTVRGIRPLIFAVHTFTPIWNRRPRNFEIGVLYDRDEREARRFTRSLRAAGLSVRYNEPYSGKKGLMYSAHRHGTHHDLRCLELEVNQGLFADPRTVPRVGAAVADALEKLTSRG